MLYLWTRYPFPNTEVGVSLTQCSQHRARFQPNLFQLKDADRSTANEPRSYLARWYINVRRLFAQEPHRNRNPENQQPSGTPPDVLGTSQPIPAVQEVWFAGCHSDVGGGSVKDTERYSLANISLRWMVKQVELSQCGIKFDPVALEAVKMDASSPTSPGSPGECDTSAGIHDQLKLQPMWWLLELLPMKYSWQTPNGKWEHEWGYVVTDSAHLAWQIAHRSILKSFFRINRGRGRQIRTEQPCFHKTVRQRMAIEGLNYKPRAEWAPHVPRYVE